MSKRPIRRCIACRKSAEKQGLLRFVFESGGVIWDEEKKRPGRGAYVHHAVECLSKVLSPKIWAYALKTPASVQLQTSIGSLLDDLNERGTIAKTGRASSTGFKNKKKMVRL